MNRRGLAVVTALVVAAAPALAQGAGRTTSDGVYSEAQAARGKAVYAEACANCHGADATGGGGGPTLTGPFWAAWTGRSLGALYELTKGSMPMDGPGRLSDPEYADVIAYMLSVNRTPAGASDLPANGETLTAIAIVPHK